MIARLVMIIRAISSAVEHLVYTERVGGSIPSSPTSFQPCTTSGSAAIEGHTGRHARRRPKLEPGIHCLLFRDSEEVVAGSAFAAMTEGGAAPALPLRAIPCVGGSLLDRVGSPD